MEFDDTSILKEILTLSKESAASNAKITQELTTIKDDISQMKCRMSKQDQMLENLAIQVNEQKRLAEEVLKLKELVKRQQEELEKIKFAPAEKALQAKMKISSKFFDSILNMIISAITSFIMIVAAKIFVFK